jgi:hypothetical protein
VQLEPGGGGHPAHPYPRYFTEVETVVKVVDSPVPTAVTAPMTTTAISAAISPYSMAVAPFSLAKKRAIVFVINLPQQSR